MGALFVLGLCSTVGKYGAGALLQQHQCESQSGNRFGLNQAALPFCPDGCLSEIGLMTSMR